MDGYLGTLGDVAVESACLPTCLHAPVCLSACLLVCLSTSLLAKAKLYSSHQNHHVRDAI